MSHATSLKYIYLKTNNNNNGEVIFGKSLNESRVAILKWISFYPLFRFD